MLLFTTVNKADAVLHKELCEIAFPFEEYKEAVVQQTELTAYQKKIATMHNYTQLLEKKMQEMQPELFQVAKALGPVFTELVNILKSKDRELIKPMLKETGVLCAFVVSKLPIELQVQASLKKRLVVLGLTYEQFE